MPPFLRVTADGLARGRTAATCPCSDECQATVLTTRPFVVLPVEAAVPYPRSCCRVVRNFSSSDCEPFAGAPDAVVEELPEVEIRDASHRVT
jgi:hypothetical protein